MSVWQQEEVVAGFIDDRRDLIPLFDVQAALAKRLIARGGRRVERFLDLGAGDGGFAELLLDLYPQARGVLVDFSKPMLAAARKRLGSRCEIVEGDLGDPAWRTRVSGGPYDAVVSRLAIHHLPDERKRALYAESYALLGPGGVFMNWEHVETGGLAEGLFDEFFRERLLEAEREHEHPRPDDEVLRSYEDAADDDALCTPEVQCDWLRAIGFENVDTYFKLPGLAIFGGSRPKGET